jgi:hypothetical protein
MDRGFSRTYNLFVKLCALRQIAHMDRRVIELRSLADGPDCERRGLKTSTAISKLLNAFVVFMGRHLPCETEMCGMRKNTVAVTCRSGSAASRVSTQYFLAC